MVREKVKNRVEELEETLIEARCIHHWIIEPPMGATSTGICKHCGEEREFRNQLRPNDQIDPALLGLSRISIDNAPENEDAPEA